MLFKEAISKRILDLCKENNLTPNSLSEKSTIAPSTLYDIISCKVENPSSLLLFQICKVFRITLKDFFDSDLFDKNNIID